MLKVKQGLKNYIKATVGPYKLYREIRFRQHHARGLYRHVVKNKDGRAEFLEHHLHPENYILLHYYKYPNFGDVTSPLVTAAISRRQPVLLSKTVDLFHRPRYSTVGSVLQSKWFGEPIEIWGSGFLYGDAEFGGKVAKVHAVRGPLTRNVILREGLGCPEVYGDPAVFAFDVFRQKSRNISYRVGFVPHYADRDHPLVKKFLAHPEVLDINVADDLKTIASKANQCEVIVSSSLHGLILADSLHIPSRWLGVQELVLRKGFKFQDYFLSVKRKEMEPLSIHNLSLSKVMETARFDIEPFDRELLLAACPFRAADIHSVEDIDWTNTL